MEMFDLCVIGAGPGGYVAAIHAGQKGLKVALVEKGSFGGTCLNIGCIPTKALIAGAEALHAARHAADFGVEIEGTIKPNWTKMLQRKAAIVERLTNGVASLLKAAPHSSTLALKIPRTEEPGKLQSMGLLRVRHDLATEQQQ